MARPGPVRSTAPPGVPRESFRTTELFRIYSSSLVPGLLQTEGYAAAVLGISAHVNGLPVGDSAEAAQARVERSRLIHEPGHRVVAVIEEAVLRYQVADADAMAAQLGYLLTAGALPAVSLGIIPMATRRAHWPEETFHLYDERLSPSNSSQPRCPSRSPAKSPSTPGPSSDCEAWRCTEPRRVV